MIVISSGKMRIPEEDRFVGFCGDNLHSTKQFMLKDVVEPDCIYRLYLSFDDGTVNYFVLDSKVENGSTILTWNILEEHIYKSGTVQAQIKCIGADGEIYHTTSDYFIVADSAENSDFFSNKDNSEFLRYERVLNSLLASLDSHSDAFVPTSRKVADLSLSEDVSIEQLLEALNTYPVIITHTDFSGRGTGHVGQFAVDNFYTGNPTLYLCTKREETGEIDTPYTYTWEKIASLNPDLSLVVPNERSVAGLALSADITADDLQTALNTYPVYISSSLSEMESNLKLGQLGLYTTYDGKTWTRDIYYRFRNGVTLIGGTTFNNNMLPESIKNYFDENPIEVDTTTLATKEELKQATYGQPRCLSMLDYFGADKKVVFVGDSITQGIGSTGCISFSPTDSAGNTVNIHGNSVEYKEANNLTNYETGKLLYTISNEKWYEAVDGNGWAHKLKNYLQNKFGCSVKNYGMKGVTTGHLAGQTMNSSNSELVTADDGTVRVFQGLTKGFDTVFLMIGTNDRSYPSVDTFTYNLDWIVNYLVNTDHKKVILMSSLPVVTESKNLTMAQINEAVSGVASEYNVPFISLYDGVNEYCEHNDVSLKNDLMNIDGLHPNDEGYAVMQSIICESLGINEVDKNYVDKALSEFRLSAEDKLDIANMVAEMLNTQSSGDTDA